MITVLILAIIGGIYDACVAGYVLIFLPYLMDKGLYFWTGTAMFVSFLSVVGIIACVLNDIFGKKGKSYRE